MHMRGFFGCNHLTESASSIDGGGLMPKIDSCAIAADQGVDERTSTRQRSERNY